MTTEELAKWHELDARAEALLRRSTSIPEIADAFGLKILAAGVVAAAIGFVAGAVVGRRSSADRRLSARLLDGPTVAAAIREAMQPEVRAFTAAAGRPPGLGIVLVGENPASEIYVGNKVKSGAEAGLRVDLERLPGERDARGAARARPPPQRQRGARRHPRAGAAAGVRWGRARRSGCSTRSIPPRTSTASIRSQCRPLVPGPAAPRAVHAVRRHR